MKANIRRRLLEHGVRPSAHRLAIGEYVFGTREHPSADVVWRRVAQSFPAISRATVYNTLHLFVERGLLRELHIAPDSVVFDPNTETHHHFIDEESGTIHDIPASLLEVRNLESLRGFHVRDYQVVMRGRRTRG